MGEGRKGEGEREGGRVSLISRVTGRENLVYCLADGWGLLTGAVITMLADAGGCFKRRGLFYGGREGKKKEIWARGKEGLDTGGYDDGHRDKEEAQREKKFR